jgi:hypothetical protein
MCLGAAMEDNQTYFGFATRCFDHFYTVQPQRVPGSVIGLTDWSEPIILASIGSWLLGFNTTNSFVWGTLTNIQGPVFNIGTNVYKWGDARNYELAALTNTAAIDRNTSVAMMCYTLGHILHLNQDLTSPDHVRDAAHLLTAYFEQYGLKYYNNTNYNAQWFAMPAINPIIGWPNWQAQGFSKLLDFWDRGLYLANSAALNADAHGDQGKKLGAAEFDNGNFLGETALYNECYSTNDIHSFPFPSLYHSTTLSNGASFSSLIPSSVRPVLFPNGHIAHRIYLDKKVDGITVSNHSVVSYMGFSTIWRNLRPFTPKVQAVAVSINDDNVLQAYHNVLLPKAVEYSTGILDYFFRGTMSVNVIGYDTNLLQYTNLIVNTSGQDFKGGSFFIYQDDTNGVRTFVAQTNLNMNTTLQNCTLANGAGMTMTFPGSMPAPTNYVLVYQGTIGVTNGNASDPVDANIGIAAQRFMLWYEQNTTTNYWVTLDSLGLTNGATITGTLESGDFPFTLSAGNYEVIVNYACFDDKGTIGSIESDGPGTSCDWGNEIINTILPVGHVSIDNKRLTVTITATDNPVCGNSIGWGADVYGSSGPVSITWRAWPAQ